MSKTINFSVSITFDEEITDRNVIKEIAENIAKAIAHEEEYGDLVPSETEAIIQKTIVKIDGDDEETEHDTLHEVMESCSPEKCGKNGCDCLGRLDGKNSNEVKIWELTDPDNFQYGKKLKEGVYLFKEFDRNNYSAGDNYDEKIIFIDSVFDNDVLWIEEQVNISMFTDKDKEEAISGCYSSLDELKRICQNDMEQVNWIVAECLFEESSGLY